MRNQKLLVQLVHNLNHRQIFFGLWFVIAAGFTALMLAFYRKRSERNFRTDDRFSRYPTRKAVIANPSKSLVVKSTSSVPADRNTENKS